MLNFIGEFQKQTFVFILFFSLIGFVPVCNAAADQVLPFKAGEVITYDIKSWGLKSGTATLEFKGPVMIDDQDSLLIVFTSKGMNFFDEEKIYVHPRTFYPIKVKRDLNIFGKKERIIEDYLYDEGIIKITKSTKKQTSSQSIEKPGRIDNIYGFIFRQRKQGSFKKNKSFKLSLPTRDVAFKFIKKDTIKANNGSFESYFLQSDPSQYKVWFATQEGHIPLRIDGAIGFGKTSMVMRKYDEGY